MGSTANPRRICRLMVGSRFTAITEVNHAPAHSGTEISFCKEQIEECLFLAISIMDESEIQTEYQSVMSTLQPTKSGPAGIRAAQQAGQMTAGNKGQRYKEKSCNLGPVHKWQYH